jgi:UDP-N-acetylglucosamine transferase subunit ALG13
VIFVTVGSQEPFDRLIRAVDEWAGSRARSDVFAQVGSSTIRPQHMEFTQFLEPAEFGRLMREARVIVAHAGMGSIISALELGKQIVVLPRRASFRETRNDHQVATAERFGAQGRILVASEENDLPDQLDYALTLGSADCIDTQASPRLLATVRAFLDGNSCQLDPVGAVSPGKSAAAERSVFMEPAVTAPPRRVR